MSRAANSVTAPYGTPCIESCEVEFRVSAPNGPFSTPETLLDAVRREILPTLSEILETAPYHALDIRLGRVEIDLGQWPDDPIWSEVRAILADKLRWTLEPYLSEASPKDGAPSLHDVSEDPQPSSSKSRLRRFLIELGTVPAKDRFEALQDFLREHQREAEILGNELAIRDSQMGARLEQLLGQGQEGLAELLAMETLSKDAGNMALWRRRVRLINLLPATAMRNVATVLQTACDTWPDLFDADPSLIQLSEDNLLDWQSAVETAYRHAGHEPNDASRKAVELLSRLILYPDAESARNRAAAPPKKSQRANPIALEKKRVNAAELLPNAINLKSGLQSGKLDATSELGAMEASELRFLALGLIPVHAKLLRKSLIALAGESRAPKAALISVILDLLSDRPVDMEAARLIGEEASSPVSLSSMSEQDRLSEHLYSAIEASNSDPGPQIPESRTTSGQTRDIMGHIAPLRPGVHEIGDSDKAALDDSSRMTRSNAPDPMSAVSMILASSGFEDREIALILDSFLPYRTSSTSPSANGAALPVKHTADNTGLSARKSIDRQETAGAASPPSIRDIEQRNGMLRDSAHLSSTAGSKFRPEQPLMKGHTGTDLAKMEPRVEALLDAGLDRTGRQLRAMAEMVQAVWPGERHRSHDEIISSDDALTKRRWRALLADMMTATKSEKDIAGRLGNILSHFEPNQEIRETVLRHVIARLTYGAPPGFESAPKLRAGLVTLLSDRVSDWPEDQIDTLPNRIAEMNAPTEARNLMVTEAAGVVLLHPFLKTLFERLGVLTGDNQIEADLRPRAQAILLALAPQSPTDVVDPLHHVLLGLPKGALRPTDIILEPEATEMIESLLRSVITHWGRLGKTSPDGLRETFLVRTGTLRFVETGTYLRVTPGPFDMLLDGLPWSLGSVALPWMPAPCHVTWRGDHE